MFRIKIVPIWFLFALSHQQVTNVSNTIPKKQIVWNSPSTEIEFTDKKKQKQFQ